MEKGCAANKIHLRAVKDSHQSVKKGPTKPSRRPGSFFSTRRSHLRARCLQVVVLDWTGNAGCGHVASTTLAPWAPAPVAPDTAANDVYDFGTPGLATPRNPVQKSGMEGGGTWS